MVACAVAANAVHPSSSVVGGGERRAPVASPEVSRAALLPPKAAAAGAMTATPAASVEQLKQQLQTAIENKDSEKATVAIDDLERISLTREVLETTRIGLAVNNARKEMSELWPSLAKRCRGLIKAWQKLVEPSNPSSASTSRNGTPGLVSPAIGRRLTPHTPARRGITPGLANERSSNLSPANGSYAPKATGSSSSSSRVQSPVLHKSQSVGNDLENGTVRNGKRRPDEPAISLTPSSIKRAKTTASGLSAVGGALTSPAPPSTPSLIEARRAAVQSTSDLVAQLTSNLPQHLGFEDAAKAHEEKVKREMEDQQLAAALASGGLPAQSPYVFDKKRKYERKKPLTGTSSSAAAASGGAAASSSSTTTVRIVTPPADDEKKGGIVLKLSLSRTATDSGSLAQTAAAASERERKEEKERRKKEKRESAAAALHSSKSAPSLASMDRAQAGPSKVPDAGPAPGSTLTSSGMGGASTSIASMKTTPSAASSVGSTSTMEEKKNKEKIDWFAMVPSIEELKKRAERDKERRNILSGMKDSEKAYTVHVGDRVVLALPYIEIEDRPDFLKFNYPDPGRFYAEENFAGGLMERPVHPATDAAATSAAATPSTSATVAATAAK